MVKLPDNNNIKMSDDMGGRQTEHPGVDESGRDPVQAMRMSIRDAEEGHQELGKAALEQLASQQIGAGDNVTLYRIANRDVAAGKPAKLTMAISKVDPDRHAITFSGRYESASGIKDFDDATLTIFPDGSVVMPDPDAPEERTLWIRRNNEDFLLFTDRPATSSTSAAASETAYGQTNPAVVDDIRKGVNDRTK